jgi:hypothetical protein
MTGSFVHVVFFWLREPQNAGHREQFEASINRFLKASRHAGEWHVGIPAGTDRKVVDNSYTYSLLVNFTSAAEQDLYQTEPAHHTFIEEAGHLWERVQVYDTLII